ncbi:MAG: nuclear transport factor 2 family protein [Cyclobacteriaceae bacterium]
MNSRFLHRHISLCLLVLVSCSGPSVNTRQVVTDYCEVYQAHDDFEKFMEFYDDKVVLEDMINGDRIEGKEDLRSFFNWTNPDLQPIGEDFMIIRETIVDGSKAAVKGYFAPFRYGESEFEAMQFTTILTFNDAGKIVRHVDWINYPNTLVDYNKRKNSNEWLK